MTDIMTICICAAGAYVASNLLSTALPALFGSPQRLPVVVRARSTGRRSRY